MATTTKPSSFLRSSERKVTDPHEAIVIRADRRRQKELEAFESPAGDAVGRGGCIHDESRMDLEGLVFP